MVRVLQQPGKGSTKKKATEAGRRAWWHFSGASSHRHHHSTPPPLSPSSAAVLKPAACVLLRFLVLKGESRPNSERSVAVCFNLLVASGMTRTKDLPSFLITQNSLEAESAWWLHGQCLSNQLAAMPGGKYQLWQTRYPKEPKTEICEVRCFVEQDFQIYHSLLRARRVWAFSWGDTSSDSTWEGPLHSPLVPPPGLSNRKWKWRQSCKLSGWGLKASPDSQSTTTKSGKNIFSSSVSGTFCQTTTWPLS